MTTDIIVRYAKNVNYDNDIADFSRYGVSGENIAAVSWELPTASRKEEGENLLKCMVGKILPDDTVGNLQVMVTMSASQPDNAIVKYKKTWGLLNANGITIDDISHKVDFLIKSKNKLILSGVGTISLESQGIISSLFNCDENVYFSLIDYGRKVINDLQVGTPSEWMKLVWENGGIVFMLLGYFDETDCELVALSYEDILKPYIS